MKHWKTMGTAVFFGAVTQVALAMSPAIDAPGGNAHVQQLYKTLSAQVTPVARPSVSEDFMGQAATGTVNVVRVTKLVCNFDAENRANPSCKAQPGFLLEKYEDNPDYNFFLNDLKSIGVKPGAHGIDAETESVECKETKYFSMRNKYIGYAYRCVRGYTKPQF